MSVLIKGANLNIADINLNTALGLAAAKDHALVFKILLEAGANPDLANKKDQTARDMAGPNCLAVLAVSELPGADRKVVQDIRRAVAEGVERANEHASVAPAAASQSRDAARGR